MSLVRRMCIFGVVAFGAGCSGFDGGLEPIGKLPPPIPPEVVDGVGDGEVVEQPVLTFVKPAAAASVDGDWIAVELALEGATLDGDSAIVVTTATATGDPIGSTTLTALTGVVMAPAGAVVLHAELTVGGAPLTPPVSAEVSVTVTRVTPGLAFVAPLAGARFDLETPVGFELALTDFALLTAGASPSGPRQGRVSLAIDGGEAVVVDAKTGALPAQAAGEHTLTATLVDAAGLAWDPLVSASVAFSVDLPPLVTITSPVAAATVEGSRLTIVIATERFVLDGAATAGHGTWLARLDGTQVAYRLTGTSVSLSGLAAGAHTLEVELRTSDDRPLTPPVTATVAFDSLLLPPALDIVLPTSAKVAEGAVRVAVMPHFFAFTNGAIPGPLVPATGGWQLLVDDVLRVDRLTTAQTEVLLTPGLRKVTARLIDNAGAQLVPPVEVSRTIEVVEVQTTVEILSPQDGETVPKRFPVAVAFEDFKLTQTVLAPNDPPVPGQGHFHAFLRKEGTSTFVYQGFFLSETFELQADSAGRWDVLVALHYENHSPVLPAVEDVITVVVDDRPTIHIQTPINEAVIGRDPFAVSVAIDNFQLIPIGEVSNTKGHYHLFIDSVYQDFYLEPFALIDPARTLPAALAPGAHRLEAFLHRSNHTPVEGAVGHGVDFVYDPTPRVRMLTPMAAAAGAASPVTVTTDPFEVSVELDNLTLVDKAGEAAVPGEGHVHIFVDDVYQGFETRSRFPLAIATPGAHSLKLTLHENDHSAIAGAVAAFIDLLVDATPRVRIEAPEDMGFVYGGDIDVLLASENMPVADGGLVELWLDEVLVYDGAPGLVTLPRLGEGTHTLFTVPLSATGAPLANGEVVTVQFEAIGLTPPTVAFVAPQPNATLGSGATVTIGVAGFTLDGGLGRSVAVPGDGVWTLSVGDETWGPFATPTISLPAMPRGPARLKAELWHRDGSRVVSQAVAEVPVQIGGAGPRMSLAAPLTGEMIYGAEVEVRVDVADSELGPGKGWVSVKVDGRQQALFARTHGVVGPFATGQHVLAVELLDGDRQPYVPAVTAGGTFRVGGPDVPRLSIVAPTNGTPIDGSVDISFTVSDLALDPVGLRGIPQAGRGAVLALVDGRVKAVVTASPAKLTGLTDGPHVIELVVVGLDLMPIVPATRAQVTVR